MSREQIANDIFDRLTIDENGAILQWQDSYSYLRLKEDGLPELDVLTCVYNGEKYVEHAIKSIVLQSYPNVHLVIVSDGCTDRTVDIIKGLMQQYPNITLVEREQNAGQNVSSNLGLEYCKSEYIARMDMDDLIHPLRFERQMKYLLKHKDVAALSSYMKVFNEDGVIKTVTYREDFETQKVTLLFYSPLSHAATIFRGDVLRKFRYDASLKLAEDYDLLLKIYSEYKAAVLTEYLYLYRTHTNQTTNEKNDQIRAASCKVIMQKLFVILNFNIKEPQLDILVKYNLLGEQMADKKAFLVWNAIMDSIYNANMKSNFFSSDKLKSFVFMYIWIDAFDRFKNQLSMHELKRTLNSPFCHFSKKRKLIFNIKKLFGFSL